MAKELDGKFIERATEILSFNIKGEDMSSLKYKREIQFLYSTIVFKGFNPGSTIPSLNITKINSAIEKLKTINRAGFDALYDFQPKGIGPGETLIYFLVSNAHLGGGTSAGVDAKIGGTNYEIKGAKLSGDQKYMTGFKLGGTVRVSEEVNEALSIKEALGLETKGKGQQEINASQIELIKQEEPKTWKQIEDSFKEKAYRYLSTNEVIFFNNNRSNGKLTKTAGGIIVSKKVKKTEISIETLTQGQFKPRVKV
jgi:hypothetical protein